MMKIWIRIGLCLSVGYLTGCAFGTRTAMLSYPPKESAGGIVEAAQAAEAPPAPLSRTIALSVADARSERDRIGNVRNGFGMDTANVVTNDDVRAWIESALQTELEGAGYAVVLPGRAQPIGDAIDLRAEILTVYCDVYLTYDGEVTLMVTLGDEARNGIRKQLAGEGSVGINWAATAASYSESLALALQDVISQIIAELSAYQ